VQEAETLALRARERFMEASGFFEKAKVPTTLVCTNAPGPAIERST